MTNSFNLDRKTLYILAALLIIAAAAQAQNMFQFPYYHDDEGTQVANSWALATEGELSPYTYSYEDPPLGSIMLASWTSLVGGPSSFGFALNAGRVFMLLLHVVSTGLIYLIAKKLSLSDLAAAVATLVFAFSPLATGLQRIVLLENIMLMWLLLSFYFAIGERRTLYHYLGSAFALSLAVLTKGGAIFFIPALLYAIGRSANRHHRRFAVALWITITLIVLSFYPLYAQMKEELFPEDWLLGGDFPHVSLIERLGDRGPDTGHILDIASGLTTAFDEWLDLANPTADPVLIYFGLISAVFVFLLSIDNPGLRPLPLMLIAIVLQFLFGGPVYKFDGVILVAFLALCVGILVGKSAEFVYHNSSGPVRYALTAGVLVAMLYPFWSFDATRLDVYTENQIDGQLEAVSWAQQYIPADAVVVTDNYAFVELRSTHPNVHDYWRVDTDPAVQFMLLHDDACSIDYVLATPQIFSDIDTYNLDLMRRTIDRSEVLHTYENNGWPIEIRQVRKTNCLPAIASDTPTAN
ncbi:MAG: glycosyltransferase family 39 protein [Anaerolineae bacterium]|nr:glycosyltransferase family 39 protein [Anaerolineae bacterium]